MNAAKHTYIGSVSSLFRALVGKNLHGPECKSVFREVTIHNLSGDKRSPCLSSRLALR